MIEKRSRRFMGSLPEPYQRQTYQKRPLKRGLSLSYRLNMRTRH